MVHFNFLSREPVPKMKKQNKELSGSLEIQFSLASVQYGCSVYAHYKGTLLMRNYQLTPDTQ